MLKTSVTWTPRARHLERSSSRFSQGVSARDVENRSLEQPRVVPFVDDAAGDLVQFPRSEIAAVFDDEFEAPRGAQAVDRRPPEDGHQRLGNFLLAALEQFRAHLVGGQAGAVREVLEQDVHRTQVGCAGIGDERLAGDRQRFPDPPLEGAAVGLSANHLIEPGHHLVRSLQRGGVLELHGEDEVALVLLGDKADRGRGELPARQQQHAAVGQDHHHSSASRTNPPPGHKDW